MDTLPVFPLFPLPNVLLYPEAMLPLHVFEPRYVQLVEDLEQQGGDQIVLGLLEAGWENGYFEKPPVFALAGLGRVLQCRRTEEGRYNLLVQGLERVLIVEEPDTDRLYRLVRVETAMEMRKGTDEEDRSLTDALRNELIDFADGSLILKANASLGYMADLLTVALPLDLDRKKTLFANLDVFDRARQVLAAGQEVNERRRSLRRAKQGSKHSRWN